MFKQIFFFSLLFILTACGSDFHFDKTEVNVAGNIFEARVADTAKLQTRGLSGSEPLAVDEAMLFVYPDKQLREFWMKDMLFSIDLLWIEDNTIVAWQENMAIPSSEATVFDLTTYISPQPVNSVLELPAGTVKRLSLNIGDQVTWE